MCSKIVELDNSISVARAKRITNDETYKCYSEKMLSYKCALLEYEEQNSTNKSINELNIAISMAKDKGKSKK